MGRCIAWRRHRRGRLAVSKHEPVSVTLKDGRSWGIKLSATESALLMLHLQGHDFRGICNYVVPALGLDVPTRRRLDNLPNVTNRHVHQYRIINKAMAMELLSASLLACLNKPKEVRSWCAQRDGLPNYFSPSGADVTARYVNDENGEPFRVVLEVTARKAVTQSVMRKQLNQAYEHANDEAKDRDGGPVYALAINGGRIGSDPKIWKVYHDFVKKNRIKPHHIVRLLPLYAPDVVAVVRRIKASTPAGGLQFRSGLLVKVFDALISDISGEFMHGDLDPDWMCNKFVEMVISDDASGKHGNLKEEPLVLVKLNREQIASARQANEKPKGITHALICGRYGQMFGTEKQCLKYYKLWSDQFASRFSMWIRSRSYSIEDFRSTFNLRERLIEARVF